MVYLSSLPLPPARVKAKIRNKLYRSIGECTIVDSKIQAFSTIIDYNNREQENHPTAASNNKYLAEPEKHSYRLKRDYHISNLLLRIVCNSYGIIETKHMLKIGCILFIEKVYGPTNMPLEHRIISSLIERHPLIKAG